MLRVAWWLVVAWAAVYPVGFMWGVLGLSLPRRARGRDDLLRCHIRSWPGSTCTRAPGTRGGSWCRSAPWTPWLAIPVALFAWAGLVFNAALTSLCRALAVLPPEVSDLAAGGATDATPVDPSLFHALVANSALPALCEEALMRGLVLHALMATMSKRRAIVVSALCFAVIHFRIERMPDLVISGIVYGWMAARTGSLPAQHAGARAPQRRRRPDRPGDGAGRSRSTPTACCPRRWSGWRSQSRCWVWPGSRWRPRGDAS